MSNHSYQHSQSKNEEEKELLDKELLLKLKHFIDYLDNNSEVIKIMLLTLYLIKVTFLILYFQNKKEYYIYTYSLIIL